MSRQRVRRSFTVEVKSSARNGSASDIPNRLATTAEPARGPSWPWEAAMPAPEKPAPAASERPRILPSLLPVQALTAEPEPEPVVEPPLPRVRRVAAPAMEGAAPRKRGRPPKVRTAEASQVEIRAVAAEAVIVADVPMPRAVPAALAARGRSGGRAEEQVLRRGERWKRRLPRSCW